MYGNTQRPPTARIGLLVTSILCPPGGVLSVRSAREGCCGTCVDVRGIDGDHLTKGAHRSTLEELVDWTVWADQMVSF